MKPKHLAKMVEIDHQMTLLEQNSNNKEIALEILSTDGYLLWKVSPRLRDDKEVVLTAVANAGWSLAQASNRLRADKEVVVAALKHDISAWVYMSEKLSQDKLFMFKFKLLLNEHLFWSVKPYRA